MTDLANRSNQLFAGALCIEKRRKVKVCAVRGGDLAGARSGRGLQKCYVTSVCSAGNYKLVAILKANLHSDRMKIQKIAPFGWRQAVTVIL